MREKLSPRSRGSCSNKLGQCFLFMAVLSRKQKVWDEGIMEGGQILK